MMEWGVGFWVPDLTSSAAAAAATTVATATAAAAAAAVAVRAQIINLTNCSDDWQTKAAAAAAATDLHSSLVSLPYALPLHLLLCSLPPLRAGFK